MPQAQTNSLTYRLCRALLTAIVIWMGLTLLVMFASCFSFGIFGGELTHLEADELSRYVTGKKVLLIVITAASVFLGWRMSAPKKKLEIDENKK